MERHGQDMTAYTGSSIMLPCSCTDLNTNPETIRWIFIKNSVSNEIYKRERSVHTDRVKLIDSESAGNVSLIISDLTEEDDGSYRCEISTDQYKDIKLTVKGKTSFTTFIIKDNSRTNNKKRFHTSFVHVSDINNDISIVTSVCL